MPRLIAVIVALLALLGAGWWGWSNPELLPESLRARLPAATPEIAATRPVRRPVPVTPVTPVPPAQLVTPAPQDAPLPPDPEPLPDEQPEPEPPLGVPRCVRVVPSRPEPDVAEDAASAPQRGYRVVIECATADELRRVRAVMVENGIHGYVERM